MTTLNSSKSLRSATTLPAIGIRPLLMQAGLVTVAVTLPALMHRLHLPVLWLLPMHWTVLLAGLVYGWRGGGLVGALTPSLSFLLSGMPVPLSLPAMTVELATYGFSAGLLRERYHWSAVKATAVALVLGRILFLITRTLLGNPLTFAYLGASMVPGLGAAVVQLLLLPWLAQAWVRAETRDSAQ